MTDRSILDAALDEAAAAPLHMPTAVDMFDLAAPPVEHVLARLVPRSGAIIPVHTIDLTASQSRCVVGRGATLRVPYRIDYGRLSGEHCVLSIAPATGEVTLTDTSTNGVWVNNVRLTKGEPRVLRHGDIVCLLKPKDPAGSFEFDFSQPQSGDAVKAEVTCSICMCPYYRPTSVVPCLHTFCEPCIRVALSSSIVRKCPECRGPARSTTHNHKLQSLIDGLAKDHPELRRTDEQIAELERDAAEAERAAADRRRARDEDSGEEEDEDEEDDSDDRSGGSDDDDVDGRFGGGFGPGGGAAFARLVHPAPPLPMAFAFGAHAAACAQCATPSPLDGFQCPPHGRHLVCKYCRTAFPDRPSLAKELPQKCVLCHTAFCDLYLGGCKSPHGVGVLQPLKDRDDMTGLPTALFAGNTIEQDILANYLISKGIDIRKVYKECMERLAAGEWTLDVTAVGELVTPDSSLCRPCAQRAFAALLVHYRRAIPRDRLPPAVGARPDCWYGTQCHTQHKNPMHAHKYNHVCLPGKRKE